jgi:starch phosphorylase
LLDGWWSEGFNGNNGWGIDKDYDTNDYETMDKEDSEHIYQIIENKIIPLYYERDLEGVPHGWIKLIKESMRSISPFFNTRRMAKEYTKSMYLKAADYSHMDEIESYDQPPSLDYSI